MKRYYLALLLGLLFTGCSLPKLQTNSALSYHFNVPATLWEASFPLGNGRIGMMPDGGIERENIVLNEISMWSGSKQNTDNPQAYRSLHTIRQLLFEGRNDEAQELMYQTFVCKGEGSGHGDGANAPYGSYPFSEYLLSGHKVKSRQVYSLSGQQILHVLIEQVYVKSFYIFIIPFAVLIQRRIGPFNKIVVGPHIQRVQSVHSQLDAQPLSKSRLA